MTSTLAQHATLLLDDHYGTYASLVTGTAMGLHVTTSATFGPMYTRGNREGSMGGATTGTPAEGWAPDVVYLRFTAADFPSGVPHTTQSVSYIYATDVPTLDDSAQCGSAQALLKNTGAGALTQTKKVVAWENDVQIEGQWTVNGGGYLLGQGTRIIAADSSHADLAYGVKVSAAAANNQVGGATGSLSTWQGFRDELYNPAGTTRGANESFHGFNRITSEQSFVAQRSGYSAFVQIDLAGTGGGSPAVQIIQMPSPGTAGASNTIADGAFTSGSPLMTTATAPSAAWIGRQITNANVPAGTQVLNYYGAGPYTVVMNANATATASAQSVTIGELDLVGLRINQAATAGGTTTARPIEYYATGGSLPTSFLSRTGTYGTQGAFQVVNSSLVTLVGLDSTGLHTLSSTLEATGAGSAALGANCPAVTATAPYTWMKAKTSDNSVVYIPVWK